MQVRRASILVADGGGEKFQEPARRLVANIGTIAGTTTEAETAAEILDAVAAGTTVSWRILAGMVSEPAA